MSQQCLICDSEDLTPASWQPLYFVTSDAAASDFSPVLLICQKCNAIQKELSSSYISWTKNLYQNYKVSLLGEQSAASEASPQLKIDARENSIVGFVETLLRTDKSKLLEVGFGNGSLLQRIRNKFPNLVLTGLEVSDRHKNTLEKMGIDFFNGEVRDLDRTFDLIIMNNVLEHTHNPLNFLLECGRCLRSGGRMIVGLPNINSATYDLIIADHVIHTNAQHITRLAQRAQLATVLIDDQTLPDQTLLALERAPLRLSVPESGSQPNPIESDTIQNIERELKNINEEFVVFGSTIAACWAARYLKEKLLFFIDENPVRVGLRVEGIEVRAPSAVSTDQKILFLGHRNLLAQVERRLDFLGRIVHINDLEGFSAHRA